MNFVTTLRKYAHPTTMCKCFDISSVSSQYVFFYNWARSHIASAIMKSTVSRNIDLKLYLLIFCWDVIGSFIVFPRDCSSEDMRYMLLCGRRYFFCEAAMTFSEESWGTCSASSGTSIAPICPAGALSWLDAAHLERYWHSRCIP